MPRFAVCSTCKRTGPLHARGLCVACYGRAWKREEFGPHREPRPAAPEPVYCDCPEYVAQPIPLFATSQCATCARPAAPPSPTTTKDPGDAATTTVPAEATP